MAGQENKFTVRKLNCWVFIVSCNKNKFVQRVPLATEPGISLIILTPMKILQQNLNRSMFVVWELNRNVYVVCFRFRCNILISGKIIKEMPGLVASGTPCIMYYVPSIYNCISVQWYYIYTQVTLRHHVSTVNGHLQANRIIFKVQ